MLDDTLISCKNRKISTSGSEETKGRGEFHNTFTSCIQKIESDNKMNRKHITNYYLLVNDPGRHFPLPLFPSAHQPQWACFKHDVQLIFCSHGMGHRIDLEYNWPHLPNEHVMGSKATDMHCLNFSLHKQYLEPPKSPYTEESKNWQCFKISRCEVK